MGRDFPYQAEVDTGHLEPLGKQYDVRDHEVKQRPCHHHKAERFERAEMTGGKRKDENLSQH